MTKHTKTTTVPPEVATVSANVAENSTSLDIPDEVLPSAPLPSEDGNWSLRRRNILNLSLDLSNIAN